MIIGLVWASAAEAHKAMKTIAATRDFISPLQFSMAEGGTTLGARAQFFWKTSLAIATADTALGQPE